MHGFWKISQLFNNLPSLLVDCYTVSACWPQDCQWGMSPGGVLPIWWVIHMCRGFDPLFWSSGYQTRSFWGVFSHPPTQKRSFGYKSSQNSIFLAPKYHFPLDLFGSNFQWPTAHPQQFSDRVPPPGGMRHDDRLLYSLSLLAAGLSVGYETWW